MNGLERKIWLDLSGMILLIGGFALLLFSPAIFISHIGLKMTVAMLTMPIFFLASVLIPAFCFFRREFWKELKLAVPGVNDILPAASGILLAIVFAMLTALKNKLWFESPPQVIIEYAKNCPLYIFCIIIISAGFLAPIAEELAYRLILFEWCKLYIPGKKILHYLIPSVLFAVSHGLIWQSFLLFFLALVLQWAQITGSTTRAILIHSVFNWCSLTVLILVRSGVMPLPQ